jgi:hypothetical protein
MKMKLLVPILAATIAAPVICAGGAEAAEYRRSKAEQKYAAKSWKYRYTRRDDALYAARAHDVDPAGDYRGYPNWARVALSPKFDGGGNRR